MLHRSVDFRAVLFIDDYCSSAHGSWVLGLYMGTIIVNYILVSTETRLMVDARFLLLYKILLLSRRRR